MKEQLKYIVSTFLIVFITVVWVNAWNWLTATNWDTLDATKWNQLVEATVPTWAVMAFNLSSCPTWWIAANGANWTPDLRWEFIRWLDSGRWVDTWRTLASSQTDTIQNIVAWNIPWDTWISGAPTWAMAYWSRGIWWANWVDYDSRPMTFDASRVVRTSHETRPRNIALLYCIKQ